MNSAAPNFADRLVDMAVEIGSMPLPVDEEQRGALALLGEACASIIRADDATNEKGIDAMARRKADITQADLDAIAERAQDMALEISAAADTVAVNQSLRTAQPAAKFNQLAEACGTMNRMLLVIARIADDKVQIEATLRERAAAKE